MRFALWASALGFIVGVALLTMTSGVISGFESTLKKSVIETSGHILILSKKGFVQGAESFFMELKRGHESLGSAEFSGVLQAEALVTHAGSIQGIQIFAIEDFDKPALKRAFFSELQVDFAGEDSGVVIGSSLARALNVSQGDKVFVILPKAHGAGRSLEGQKLERKVAAFKIARVVSFPSYEVDSRTVLMKVADARDLLDVSAGFSGLLVKSQVLEDGREAESVAKRIQYASFESDYGPLFAWSWRGAHRNLFEALEIERNLILLIVLTITIAAGLNLAMTLFILGLQRHRQIAVLRAIGMTSRSLQFVFLTVGIGVAMASCLIGIGAGVFLTPLFVDTLLKFLDSPGEIYKITTLEVQFNGMDFLKIITATLIIAAFASYFPSRQILSGPPSRELLR